MFTLHDIFQERNTGIKWDLSAIHKCLLSIDYWFLIVSSVKDLYHVQCHLWLIGGLIECKCKWKSILCVLEGPFLWLGGNYLPLAGNRNLDACNCNLTSLSGLLSLAIESLRNVLTFISVKCFKYFHLFSCDCYNQTVSLHNVNETYTFCYFFAGTQGRRKWTILIILTYNLAPDLGTWY